MLESIKTNPSVLNMQRQFEALPPRDRMMLKLLALVLLGVLLYFAAWQPAKAYMDDAKADLEYNKQILSLIQDNKKLLVTSSRNSGTNQQKGNMDSQQLVSSVTNIAKQKGVALKRFEPSGGNKLKVWVDDAAFDKMINWLVFLKKSIGVHVETITIEKDDSPGLVSARLTLSS